MFRREDGCVGALFLSAAAVGVVVTPWRDRAAAEALGPGR